MTPGDPGVGQHEYVVGKPADGNDLLAQRDRPDDLTFERDGEDRPARRAELPPFKVD